MSRFLSLFLVICCLSLAACHGREGSGDEGLSNIIPVVTGAPYASVLKECATANIVSESCTLNRLPPLGMEVANPTVADIRGRLLVSHSWMADNFTAVLNEMPDDMYRLFGGVTAIVIDDDIRPSYYQPLTGAIYLDPYGLWLTEAERSVISTVEDYRGEYIRQMSFLPFWRYTSPTVDFDERNLETITLDMARLLFHELAHANDLFPQASYDSVDTGQRITTVIDTLQSEFPSTRLQSLYPLTSADMHRIGGILYQGNQATDADRAITAAQIGAYFEPDVASDDYAYSSQYEDLAMLFEEVMMKVHFDMDRDLAFVIAPEAPSPCDGYKVGWGVRNRVGDAAVLERAEWVIGELLPESDYSEWLAEFPEPQLMTPGTGWCESEDVLSARFDKSLSTPQSAPALDLQIFLRPQPLQLRQ